MFWILTLSLALAPFAQANMGKKSAKHDTAKYEHMTLTFDKGASNLTPAEQAKLTSFVNDAKAKGTIDEIEIAVWSDKSFPGKGAALSKSDQNLADDRGNSIENLLGNTVNVSQVEVYNMAEKTNWLARTFNTSDAEVKSLFQKEVDAPITHDAYMAIKNNGAAQKAVVLVKYDAAAAVNDGSAGTSGAGIPEDHPVTGTEAK